MFLYWKEGFFLREKILLHDFFFPLLLSLVWTVLKSRFPCPHCSPRSKIRKNSFLFKLQKLTEGLNRLKPTACSLRLVESLCLSISNVLNLIKKRNLQRKLHWPFPSNQRKRNRFPCRLEIPKIHSFKITMRQEFLFFINWPCSVWQDFDTGTKLFSWK